MSVEKTRIFCVSLTPEGASSTIRKSFSDALPTRSNSISFDETSTSSARAIHQKRLELHTQWFRRSEASSREHAKAECIIFIKRNA